MMDNLDQKTSGPQDQQSKDDLMTANDDDSITTSTDSDTSPWTVVRSNGRNQKPDDKTNEKTKKEDTAADEVDSRVENLARYEQPEDQTPIDKHPSLDELSDGISIISESECCGRLSPHQALHQHLNDINFKFVADSEILNQFNSGVSTAPINSPINLDYLSDRVPSASEQNSEEFILKKRRKKSRPTSDLSESQPVTTETIPINSFLQLQPIVRRGLTAIFYCGVVFAFVGFIGRLCLPGWGPRGHPLEEIEQKLSDVELQNNLMRAEIDLLTKQVNYLSSLKDDQRKIDYKTSALTKGPQQTPHEKSAYKEFKNKEQETYKGKSVMRVDQPTKGEKVNYSRENLKGLKQGNAKSQENQHGQNTLPRSEKLYGEAPNTNSDHKVRPPKSQYRQNTFQKDEFLNDRENNRVEKQLQSYQDFTKHQQNNKPYKERSPNSREYIEKNHKDRRLQFSHEQRYEDDDNDDDFSGKRFQKQRYAKQTTDDHSKERNKYKRNKGGDNGYSNKKRGSTIEEANGYWHEQYMQHREDERRRNERKHSAKNWYIERGNSREQMRHN